MPDWEKIFEEKDHIFVDSHPDMSRVSTIFSEQEVKRILDTRMYKDIANHRCLLGIRKS